MGYLCCFVKEPMKLQITNYEERPGISQEAPNLTLLLMELLCCDRTSIKTVSQSNPCLDVPGTYRGWSCLLKRRMRRRWLKNWYFEVFKPHASLQVEKTVLIGRMGTNLKVGIVGLPNVGKVPMFSIKVIKWYKQRLLSQPSSTCWPRAAKLLPRTSPSVQSTLTRWDLDKNLHISWSCHPPQGQSSSPWWEVGLVGSSP